MKKRTVTELEKDEALLRKQLEGLSVPEMGIVNELIELSILLEKENNR